jgi:hypothetical protein
LTPALRTPSSPALPNPGAICHRVSIWPFAEAKEVIGGYAILELRNKAEAVASAVEFMQLHKDLMPGWEGTCEVRDLAQGH